MKNLIFIAFLLFIINSSIAQEPWFASLENNTEKIEFPFHINDNYMENIYNSDNESFDLKSLRLDDVQILCPGYDSLKNNRDFFMLSQFAFIDSLKSVERYEHYLDNEIHEGMVRVSEAFEIEHIKINSNTSLFLWGLYFESYEACPYSSGQYVMGTFIQNKKPTSVAVLGGSYSAADAPYSFDKKTSTMINGSAIEILYTETQGDDKEEESKSQTIDYLLIEGHLIQKAIRK